VKIPILCFVTVCCIVMFYSNTNILTTHYDDAYITYRYAINLANGDGLTFNPGERTDAATSFLFTGLLAALYKIGFHDMEIMSLIVLLLSHIIISIIMYNIIYIITNNKPTSFILALTTSIHGTLSGWSVMGMETAFFAMMVILFIYALFYLENQTAYTILAMLLCLTRPEGILALAVLLVMDKRGEFVASLIVVSVFYGLKYQYYGTLIPHSVQIKLLTSHGFSLRYVCSFYPVFVIMATCFMVKVFKPFEWLIIIVYLSVGTFWSVILARDVVQIQATVEKSCLEVGWYINNNIPTDKLILSSEIGGVAYVAINHKFIDGYGLTSSDVLNKYKSGKNIDSILDVRKPDYIADTYHEINGELHNKNMQTLYFLKEPIQVNSYFNGKDLDLIIRKRSGRNINYVLYKIGG